VYNIRYSIQEEVSAMAEKKLTYGMFVPIEGLDGSGKTTVARYVLHVLQNDGYPVVLTREPGGTREGNDIRAILHSGVGQAQAEFLLFAADRSLHMSHTVKPALEAGYIVISDRGADSSLAYQGYGRGVDRDMIAHVNAWVMDTVAADCIIYPRIAPAEIFQRINQRGEPKTSIEREQYAFFERVYHGFENIFANKRSVITVDATQDPETVANAALQELYQYISARERS